jgi:hypothetical protein
MDLSQCEEKNIEDNKKNNYQYFIVNNGNNDLYRCDYEEWKKYKNYVCEQQFWSEAIKNKSIYVLPDINQFYENWSGHLKIHLDAILTIEEESPKIFLAGDSSLDNKAWIKDDQSKKIKYKDLFGYYKKILNETNPAVQDVAYCINDKIRKDDELKKYVCINTSVEATTLQQRLDKDNKLLEQDQIIQENITSEDILVVSIGGNDIAFNSSIFGNKNNQEIFEIIKSLFEKIKIYIDALVKNKKPKKVIICMYYFFDLNKNSPSWTKTALTNLEYDTNPNRVKQLLIALYHTVTRNIEIDGMNKENVIGLPLYRYMDGTNTNDYDNRVEPSVEGGKKIAKAVFDAIKGNIKSPDQYELNIMKNFVSTPTVSATAISNANKLYKCYNPEYAFPKWCISFIKNDNYINEYADKSIVYFDNDTDLTDAQLLAKQREPVNIGMGRSYDQEKLKTYFGWSTGAYENIQKNIAIYCYTPWKSYDPNTYNNDNFTSEINIHLINVYALAFDNRTEQPDSLNMFRLSNESRKNMSNEDIKNFIENNSQEYLDSFRKMNKLQEDFIKDTYRRIYNKIIQCAKDQNLKNILMTGVGTAAFAGPYKTQIIRIFEEITDEVKIKLANTNITLWICNYGQNSRIDVSKKIITWNINTAPQKINDNKFSGINNNESLYVNAWDPWSIVGNGNASDFSFDGFIGRATAGSILCWPLTCPNIQYKKLLNNKI